MKLTKENFIREAPERTRQELAKLFNISLSSVNTLKIKLSVTIKKGKIGRPSKIKI